MLHVRLLNQKNWHRAQRGAHHFQFSHQASGINMTVSQGPPRSSRKTTQSRLNDADILYTNRLGWALSAYLLSLCTHVHKQTHILTSTQKHVQDVYKHSLTQAHTDPSNISR